MSELHTKLEDIKKETKKGFDELTKAVKDLKRELKGLIEIQQALVHKQLPNPPKDYGEEATKLKIHHIPGNLIKVSGNTFDYQAAIKSAGNAKWEATTKSWNLSVDNLDNLVKKLVDLKLVEGKDFSIIGEKDEKIKPKVQMKQIEEEEEEDIKSEFKSEFKSEEKPTKRGAGFGIL